MPAPLSGHLEDLLDQPLRALLSRFHERIIRQTYWLGVKAGKNPLDFWLYQELMTADRPDWVIEIGNNFGGSTLALAHLCDLLDHGRVIGVDISHARIAKRVRGHPRVTLIEGDAVASLPAVQALLHPGDRVMVIEDSAHTFDNTLAVLRAYGDLVHPGGYLIVEDTICHHGIDVGPSPGAYEAVAAFLAADARFEADRGLESFVITMNPKGFLRRIA